MIKKGDILSRWGKCDGLIINVSGQAEHCLDRRGELVFSSVAARQIAAKIPSATGLAYDALFDLRRWTHSSLWYLCWLELEHPALGSQRIGLFQIGFYEDKPVEPVIKNGLCHLFRWLVLEGFQEYPTGPKLEMEWPNLGWDFMAPRSMGAYFELLPLTVWRPIDDQQQQQSFFKEVQNVDSKQ